MAVRGPHHGDVAPDAVESDGTVRPEALDLRLAFQFHAELGEESDGGIQVVDDDANVVHPLNGHITQDRTAASRQSGEEIEPSSDAPPPGGARLAAPRACYAFRDVLCSSARTVSDSRS